MSFSDQQTQLICVQGHAVALAGPGSGKTSTIIEKIARLLQQPGNSVVACSFTREGAEEIRRRLTKRIGDAAMASADIRIGTFHSVIAEHRKTFGRSPKMISPAHQMKTLATVAREHGMSLGDVMPEFEEIKHQLSPPDANSLPAWLTDYESHLKTLGAIDLQDLIRATVQQMALSAKLPEPPDSPPDDEEPMPLRLAFAAAAYRDAFNKKREELSLRIEACRRKGNTQEAVQLQAELTRTSNEDGALPLLPATHLVIDESQDNDELQFALATLHALAGVTTTLIGDDDQTIYEWRRAMGYPGLLSFANTFNATVITLGDNYRSLRTIVEAADQLIRHNNGHRIEKVFVAKRGPGGSVLAEQTNTEWGMVELSAKIILEHTQECADPSGRFKRQVETGQFGILSRNNFILDDIEAELMREGVRYVRQGTSILQKEAAKYIYELLGAVYGFDIKGISFLLQIHGVSASMTNNLCREITGHEMDFVNGRLGNFQRFGEGSNAIDRTVGWLVARRAEVDEKTKSREVIGSVCAVVREVLHPAGPWDRKNIQNRKCIAAVQRCLERMNQPVLTRVAMLQNRDFKGAERNAVSLMTFHGSKGLEFNKVILLGADDDVCPGKGEFQSERRLFYVAVTRAKDSMLALYSGKPSRYLAEMGLT